MILFTLPIIFLLLLMLALLLYLAIGGYNSLTKTRSFLATAAPAEAIVVGLPSRLRRVSSGNGGSYPLRVFEPVVRFQTAQGQTIEARVEVGTPTPSAAINQTTPILYNPALPQQVRLAEATGSTSAIGPIVAGCFGILVLLMTLACLGISVASTVGSLSQLN
jgi:hypothetical protein